jgi:hypothetical protein
MLRTDASRGKRNRPYDLFLRNTEMLCEGKENYDEEIKCVQYPSENSGGNSKFPVASSELARPDRAGLRYQPQVTASPDDLPHLIFVTVQLFLHRPLADRCRAHLKSFRATCPPFITNLTRSSSVMSVRGSPETATISANLPFSIDPTRSCQPIISALTEVAARSA